MPDTSHASISSLTAKTAPRDPTPNKLCPHPCLGAPSFKGFFYRFCYLPHS
ncbi:MAG: hypothetical protein KGD66_05185 [Candidatus Lokiarchaeota archaeon]|nr:hypothetical protein [Candidatus Lokiarchaeota archaeon]